MKTEDIKLTEHIVAYIDILGATEMIYENDDDSFKNIYKIYTRALERYKKLPDIKKENLKIKIFSDNILISYEICHENSAAENKYRNAIKNVLSFISSLYWEFSEKAILIRGGITVGNLFHDGTLVWGEGLVRAYNLENKVAKYPRIVIDNRLLEKIRHKRYFFDFIEPFIFCANDGVSYFNWLNKLFESAEVYIETMERFKGKFEKKLEEYKSKKTERLDIIQKNEWHLSYIKDNIENHKDGLREITENPAYME